MSSKHPLNGAILGTNPVLNQEAIGNRQLRHRCGAEEQSRKE
jgi:hypothetical protein